MLSCIVKDVNFVLKKQLTQLPFMGHTLKKMGSVAVARDGSMADIKNMIAQAKRAVKRGDKLVIFPEGTRKNIGDKPDYKGGISMLYNTLDTPIVPVALNSGVYWGRKIFRRRGEIIVRFLPKIEAKSKSGLKKDKFMTLLQDTIETESNKLL